MSVDRYKAMEVFNRVVELGSFTAAATALHMIIGGAVRPKRSFVNPGTVQ